jgi:succinoglycan biosynthesis protein ExoM
VLPVPSGTPIIAGGIRRTRDFSISTASSIWRAARCFADREPFDPAFGACGGEDLDLFLRLEARGCRFVWCAEAGVHETIPASRIALWTHMLRTYSGAQVYAAASVKNAHSPMRTSIDVMTRGAAQAAASGTLVPLLLPFGGPLWQQRLLAAASGLGKVMWWRKLPVYHVEKPSE